MDPKYLEILLSSAGAALGAAVTVWWFFVRRELEPASELTIDVYFAGKQAQQVLIEVIATLTNKSMVRQHYRDFQVSLRYLLPGDAVTDGSEKIGYQLQFPNSIDSRISSKRFFANAVYINPKLAFRHSYITSVPENATFLWVNCKLLFRTRNHWYSVKSTEHMKNAQRLFCIPRDI
jgi:hypothetical protein